mgnify:CR=1 FL=1
MVRRRLGLTIFIGVVGIKMMLLLQLVNIFISWELVLHLLPWKCFLLNNEVPNFSKKKKRLVVDGDVIYWEVNGKKLSNEEAKRLLEEIDNEYFENSKDD